MQRLPRMIRHSVTEKLYWIGNISAVPPNGNSPRYPLVIAEVDEEIPALKKNTVTEIDNRQSGQSAAIQFSNFSIRRFVVGVLTPGEPGNP